MGSKLRKAIQDGSRKVDREGVNPKTLWQKNAYQHAMTPGSKVKELGSVEKAKDWAKKEAVNFIKDNLKDAKAIYDKSQTTPDVGRPALWNDSLEKFGAAMHTVMDNQSPAHKDFQVYNVEYQGILSPASDLVGDITGLYEHGKTEEREPTEAEMNLMVDEIRVNFQQTYGNELYERFVSKEERKATADRVAKHGTDEMLR